MLRHLALYLIVSLGSNLVQIAGADDATDIQRLIPAASAMSLSDFDKIATSQTAPKISDLEQKTLTWMLFSLKPTDDKEKRKHLRFLVERPKPVQYAKEMTRLVVGRGRLRFATGPVTMIHADRITNCTCDVEGDQATGVFSFHVPKLMEGHVNYAATRSEQGKWEIREFRISSRKIHITRGDDGKWTKK